MDEQKEPASSPRTYTIPEFCEAERFSQSFYYKMKKKGVGPREMHILGARRITEDARREWHKRCEQGAA